MDLTTARNTLAALEGIGYTPPSAVTAALAAADALPEREEAEAATEAALAQAVRDGDAERTRAAAREFMIVRAIASATGDIASVANLAKGTATTTASALIAEVVKGDGYQHLKAAFDAAGQRLAESLQQVDPDAPLAAIAKLRPKSAAALAAIEPTTEELERLFGVLGLVLNVAKGRDGNVRLKPLEQLGAACALGAADHRALPEKWTNPDSRAGRWVAVVRAGATISAPATPDAWTAWDVMHAEPPVPEPEPAPVPQFGGGSPIPEPIMAELRGLGTEVVAESEQRRSNATEHDALEKFESAVADERDAERFGRALGL
jgi:hypothetical protein